MNQLYKVVGISKQAVHKSAKRQEILDHKVQILLHEADQLRSEHPGCGIEKMYYTLKPDFIGRDRFIALFMELGFRIQQHKNYRRTTYPAQVNYPNLIKGLGIQAPSTVWQSDITYIRVLDKFYYTVFIIDVYTKMIVGYCLSKSLRAEANVRALTMAFKHHQPPVIHHSDRGSQYIYTHYLEMLKKNDCKISMALSAQDNAYAERINGIIKNEYLKRWKINSYEKLQQKLSVAVKHYNNQRLHGELKRETPIRFEKTWATLDVNQRPRISIFDNNK